MSELERIAVALERLAVAVERLDPDARECSAFAKVREMYMRRSPAPASHWQTVSGFSQDDYPPYDPKG